VHQSQCVTLPELVPVDGSEHPVLLFVLQSGELVTERRTDSPVPKLVLCTARQPAPQRQASLDPFALVPEEPADSGRAELLLVAKRANHPRLVQCRRGARRRIGHQEPTLAFRTRPSLVHHHRHRAVSLLAPTGKPLEAVQYLVGAVCPGSDQQGEFRSGLLSAGGNARAQPLVARLEPFDGYHLHSARNLTTSRTGPWPRCS
jgi:hypothetical protein